MKFPTIKSEPHTIGQDESGFIIGTIDMQPWIVESFRLGDLIPEQSLAAAAASPGLAEETIKNAAWPCAAVQIEGEWDNPESVVWVAIYPADATHAQTAGTGRIDQRRAAGLREKVITSCQKFFR